MSAFKAKTFNPMRAPAIVSTARLTFLQGLTPPPEAVRNVKVEAYDKEQARLLRRRKRRSKSVQEGSTHSAGSAGSKQSIISTLVDQNNDLRTSLSDMRNTLACADKQLSSLTSSPSM